MQRDFFGSFFLKKRTLKIPWITKADSYQIILHKPNYNTIHSNLDHNSTYIFVFLRIMNKINADVLIVGQGIVGTVLAHTLIKHEKSVIIIDDPKLSSSSRVSAGLFNPVVFKRLTQSWKVDELIDLLVPFYKESEKLFGEKLLFDQKILKIFSEEQERTLWEKKMKEEVGKYLLPVSDEPIKEFADMPFGHASVLGAGYLNVQKFLSLSRKYFLENKMMRDEIFEPKKMKITEGGISYDDGIIAKKIIYCEGYKGMSNPYFNWIPFKRAKGELLTVKIKNYHFVQVINKAVFVAPLGNDLYRVGSTFVWDTINDDPTEEGKAKLTESLRKVVGDNFEIIDHKAGVRPSISDRRPVLGMHPEHEQLVIFNGMGSKGVMLSPYFAEHLVQHLYEGKELNREVDIRRFEIK